MTTRPPNQAFVSSIYKKLDQGRSIDHAKLPIHPQPFATNCAHPVHVESYTIVFT